MSAEPYTREAELQALYDVERLIAAAAGGDRNGVEAIQRQLRKTIAGLFAAAKHGVELSPIAEERRVALEEAWAAIRAAREVAPEDCDRAVATWYGPALDHASEADREKAWDGMNDVLSQFAARGGRASGTDPERDARNGGDCLAYREEGLVCLKGFGHLGDCGGHLAGCDNGFDCKCPGAVPRGWQPPRHLREKGWTPHVTGDGRGGPDE